MATPMPRLNLADLSPRRVPVTEEACEQLQCDCWRAGFLAGTRHERARQDAETAGMLAYRWLFAWLCTGLLVLLLLAWQWGAE